MKHVYESRKQNTQGQWKYYCSCGFQASSEGSMTIHVANSNDELVLREHSDAEPAKGE